MLLLASLFLVITGCAPRIDTIYGQRKGQFASESVNGTAVLGDMFQQAGHKVFSWPVLSPKLRERADAIVWFPDDFEPPTDEVREWLEEWLMEEPERTLIYVGRDFDAAPWYWKNVLPGGPVAQQPAITTEMTAAQAEYRRQRRNTPKSKDCRWFTVERDHKFRKVTTLDEDSDPDWLEGIDPAKLEIELRGRFLPGEDPQVLLKSQGDVLLSREDWYDGSQLIVVVNGSFLLNLALVNLQHRKLAGKLIDEVGPPGQTVVFLESYAGGPKILPDDPVASMPSGFEIFHIWPANWILFHLMMVGIIFCFSRWPIFGRPRQLPPPGTSDFGKHIHAMAELLQRSRDRSFAMTRLLHYQQTTKGGE